MSQTAKSVDFINLNRANSCNQKESSSGQKIMYILSSIFKDRPKTILFNYFKLTG